MLGIEIVIDRPIQVARVKKLRLCTMYLKFKACIWVNLPRTQSSLQILLQKHCVWIHCVCFTHCAHGQRLFLWFQLCVTVFRNETDYITPWSLP